MVKRTAPLQPAVPPLGITGAHNRPAASTAGQLAAADATARTCLGMQGKPGRNPGAVGFS